MTVDAGRTTMDALLSSGGDPFTAVIAGNDQLAVGVLRSLRSHGLDCPGDMSVIGFNDMPYAEDINPALTTVRVPLQEFGTEAARLLLNNIEQDSQGPVTVGLPVSLIVRASTGRVPR
jgi:LacI family transcriptional regulator